MREPLLNKLYAVLAAVMYLTSFASYEMIQIMTLTPVPAHFFSPNCWAYHYPRQSKITDGSKLILSSNIKSKKVSQLRQVNLNLSF